MTSSSRPFAFACSLLLLAVPAHAQDLCRDLRDIMAVRDLRTLAGSLEQYNATKPAKVEDFQIDGGEFSQWEARRSLPGFVACTVTQYVTVKFSGAREAMPLVYNCYRSAAGSKPADDEFEELSRAIHACLPEARRTDDVPAEATRKWAGEQRATIRQSGAKVIVSWVKDERRAKLNVDISRE